MKKEVRYVDVAKREALKRLLLVFMYAGGSAILPTIIAFMADDPKWLVLSLLINALWAAFDKYMKVKKLYK